MIPKFRVWDKNNKKMLGWKELDLTKELGEDEITIFEPTGQFAQPMYFYEAMQSTGLKDKNGTEIYEGDIIRGPYDTGIIGYEMVTTEVKYDLLKGFQLGQFDLNVTEVIGNIYENPEKCRFVEREF